MIRSGVSTKGPNILRYLRDCYQADRRGATVWNIFHRKIQHRLVLRGEEQLLNGFLPYIPVDAKRGAEAAKAAQVYRNERDLIYGCFFVTGLHGELALCSPLFMIPATVREQDGQSLLSINLEERRLNGLLLETLCPDNDRAAAMYEEILHAVPEEISDFSAVGTLLEILHANIPGVDIEPAYRFPHLVAESTLRAASKAEESSLRVMPAAAVALIPRSTELRGILNDLRDMADAGNFSMPVRRVLGAAADCSEPAPASPDRTPARVPSILSKAQQAVLTRAAHRDLSLVIGPPGTGKSFTIASIALEHLSRGKTVLIASRTNQAVDVIGNKIENQLDASGCLVRGGRKAYLRELKRSLDQLLHGILPADPAAERSVRQWSRGLLQLDRRIAELEKQFKERNQWELRWGRFLADQPCDGVAPGILAGVKHRYLGWRVSRQVLHSDLLAKLERALSQRVETIVRTLQRTNRDRLERLLDNHREELMTFLKALRARRRARQEELFGRVDFRVLLEAFPLWLVNLSDAHEVLPLQAELFDLVVIDEATQCDMSGCLPVLQRGRRAVIVGDPRQLRHLSFLSRGRQDVIANEHGLTEDDRALFDYRHHSILDLVSRRLTSQRDVLFLDEHFRSLPPIIAFSNREFYDGALRIMTHTPRQMAEPPLEIHWCRDAKRDAQGVNSREAGILLDDVEELINQQAHLDPATAQSIGVLSPFRDQIDYIAERLNQRLSSAALRKHQVMTGTAHTFQGEERDVMFLSMAVDAESHPAAFYYLNRDDQFNVSITRARSRQHVYASVRPQDLDPDSLLAQYLTEDSSPLPNHKSRQSSTKDEFLHDVAGAMRDLGFSVWPSFTVAGTEIDLVIECNNIVRGIDLIGYPGQYENAFTLERYQMFLRAGLHIIPLSYASWRLRRQECIDAIQQAMHTQS